MKKQKVAQKLLFFLQARMKNKIKKNPRLKIEKLTKKPCFIVFNNFSSCIIEHIIFNIITTITE